MSLKLSAVALLLVSCKPRSARLAAAGEAIIADFVCLLSNGELAVISRQSVAKDASIKRSVLFAAPKSDAPVKLVAGHKTEPTGAMGMRSFEDEVLDQLSAKAVGMPVDTGKSQHLTLTAEPLPRTEGDTHFLPLARIRRRAKQQMMSVDEFVQFAGKSPAVGQVYSDEPSIMGRVTEVSGDLVFVESMLKAGSRIDTPYGNAKGLVRDAGDSFEIVVDAHVGDLVRSGPIVGRVSEVREERFVIDYAHPFGGETLACDVRLTSDKGGD